IAAVIHRIVAFARGDRKIRSVISQFCPGPDDLEGGSPGQPAAARSVVEVTALLRSVRSSTLSHRV
ncbi:MAG TPA: hypothetical protein VM409_00600, partial [Chloroflexia bacterium]|nr:hypothetical protein [Chloroflexia bacterium]